MHVHSHPLASHALALVSALLAGGACAAGQGAPNYAGFDRSQCLPYANPAQAASFEGAPLLNLVVQDPRDDNPPPVEAIHEVTMDTGSVGLALDAARIPGYAQLKRLPEAKPGTQFLSSSKILWVGTWVPLRVTLFDAQRRPVASARVPVLGVETAGVCRGYVSGDATCKQHALPPAKDLIYMGVGFGREADSQPQGTPDKNVLLHLDSLGGKALAEGQLSPGYIIGRGGITLGLTPENTQGFGFVKLQPYGGGDGDWQAPSMCVSLDPQSDRSASGPLCVPGSLLVDTGVPQSYITLPTAIRYRTAKEPDASARKVLISVLAKGTEVELKIPDASAPVAQVRYQVGGTQPVTPLQVIPWSSDNRPPFVNTGRHFLRQYQFLYDARQGYVGFKAQTDGCGGA
ncbi:hypothetical protein [Pseudomonas sp. RIT-PI-AD]|uniref:hypothetical protein n=1 Tax=Pseudomonas sp. RIT-PI-AD TaxID=3035294 RepID=UPI0021DAE64D|nr:hypothetical protein [Pseudomonas sp. RIT-PI-AD]